MDELARARANKRGHGRYGYNPRYHGYFVILTRKDRAALMDFRVMAGLCAGGSCPVKLDVDRKVECLQAELKDSARLLISTTASPAHLIAALE